MHFSLQNQEIETNRSKIMKQMLFLVIVKTLGKGPYSGLFFSIVWLVFLWDAFIWKIIFSIYSKIQQNWVKDQWMVDGRLKLGLHSETYSLPMEWLLLSSYVFSGSCLADKTQISLEIQISKTCIVSVPLNIGLDKKVAKVFSKKTI